ncbi:hypothetical protein GW17_00053295 [Ensete ventricosum]|nr:hypothetical protein GW17_00053295 [Ensete ventricosum]
MVEGSHRASRADRAGGERGGEAAAAPVRLRPGEPLGAVDDGEAVRVDQGGSVEEPERGEGHVVGGVLGQIVDVRLPLAAPRHSSGHRSIPSHTPHERH